jgi:hypothetical protein
MKVIDRTVPGRGARCLMAAAVMLLVAALFATGASAAFTWSDRAPVDPTNTDTAAIECPTASLCLIGGDADHIATSTDPTGGAAAWSVAAVPGTTVGAGQIRAISCPEAGLCVAVDSAGRVLYSTNPSGGASTWTFQTAPLHNTSPRDFESLSCPSGSACVATALGEVLVGAPQNGEHWAQVPGVFGNSASCGQAACALGEGGAVVVSSGPSATQSAWHEYTIAPFNGHSYEDLVASVSCTTSICVGGGGGPSARVYSSTNPLGGASAWAVSEPLTSNLAGMECVSQSRLLCAGWAFGGSFVWTSNDPGGGIGTWSVAEGVATLGAPSSNDHVAGVSCPTSERCFAATDQGYVVIGTGEGGEAPGGGGGGGAGTGGGGGTQTGTTPPSGPIAVAHKPGQKNTGKPPQVTLEKPTYGTDAVGFLLQCSEGATGALTGYTSGTYTFTELASDLTTRRARRIHVKLGSVHFKLAPHKPKKVTLKLSRQAKTLLRKHGKLKANFTVTLKNAAGATGTTSHTYTIKRQS